MKKNIKNYLRIGLLLFGVSSLLWNCEQENHLEHQPHQLSISKSIERHVISLEMLEKSNILAYEILTGLSKDDQSKSSRSQNIYSEEYDLHYNLDKIYTIEEEHYLQYSFLVKSSNQLDNQFENYILVQYPDDTFRQFVITYEYNSPDKESYGYVDIRELEGSQLLTRGVSSCPNLPQLTPITITYCTYTQCTGNLTGPGGGGHNYNDDDCRCGVSLPCSPASKDCTTETQWVMSCPGGGDDTNNPNNPNNPPTGGGNNSGTGEDPNDDDIPVIPIEIDYAQEIINCMNITNLMNGTNYSLSQSQEDWVNNATNRDLLPMYDFLQGNSCSQEAQELTLLALTLFLESTDPDASIEAIFRLFNGFTKPCHAGLLFKALEVNSPFVNTFRTDLVNALDNNIAIQDLPANEIPASNVYSAVTFYELTNTLQYNEIVLIVFEEEYLNSASDLALVVTLYHEMVHATMVDLYHEGTLLDNYPNYTNLNTAFENFFQSSTTANREVLDKEMHDIYIDFIDPLAASIYKYSQENNINSVTLDYAKKLVWGSLGAYDIFSDNLTSAEQIEALNLLNNEQQNNNDAVSSKTCD